MDKDNSQDGQFIYCPGPQSDDRSVTDPDNYILVNYHSEEHYELVTYKNKSYLSFDELPLEIKESIIDQCARGEDSVWHRIDGFKKMIDKRMGRRGESSRG